MSTPARDDFERTPPHDIAAEQCVLGGMLMSRDAISDVTEVITAADHYRPAHQIVHEAILRLHDGGEPASAVTVAAELTKRGEITKVGGAPYLHTLIASVPTAANAGYYARIVRERAILRRLIEAGTRIVQLGYSGDGDAEELVERARAETDALSGLAATTSAVPVSDLATGFLASLEAGPQDVPGVEVPWADFARLVPGLRAGEVTVIGGRPGSGKSVALLGIAAHAALRAGRRVLAVSLEMSRDEYMERLYAAEAGVELDHIRKRLLDDYDWDRVAKASAELGRADGLLIHDGPALSVHGIRAELLALRRAGYPADLLVIDYLQLVSGAARRAESRQAEVSDISRSVKLLAKEFGIPVVVGAQLNRGPEQRSDKRPMLADLRESGCMPASTRLLRADNGQEVTLGDLVLSQEQVMVQSVDEHQRIVPALLTRAFPSGIKPAFRLRLASGREVDATANHKFLTIDGWAPLESLAAGSFIATPRRLGAPLEPQRMDEDELVLMAHLIGDGSIGPGVKYTTIDPANKLAVEQAARSLFGIEAEGKAKGRKWDLWFPSPYHLTHGRHHPMRNWLEPYGLWGKRSGNKFIPAPLFALPDDQLALFLRHLWATDGSITMLRNGRGALVSVYYASTSRQLAENVQRALLRFEIRSGLRRRRKAGYVDCWNVVVQGSPDQRRFLERIGCHGARGEVIPEALEVISKIKPNPNADLVPWPVAGQVKAAMSRAGVSQRDLASALGEAYGGSYFLGSETRPRRFSRERLGRMADLLGSAGLKDIAESDLYWDEVAEITALGLIPTFDATVSDTHNFIANGIVAHNSVENDADIVILLYREDEYVEDSPRAGEIDFIVAKNRQGPKATMALAFQGHHSRIKDMAPAPWTPSSALGATA